MSGKAVRDTLGFLGVVASLVFVGTEIRQNTAIARASTRHAIAETDFQFVGATLDPALLAQAEAKRRAGEELTVLDSTLLRDRQHLNFRIFENAFSQYRAGLLEEETWTRNRNIIRGQLTGNEFARAMWGTGRGFEESFKNEVAEIMQESPRSP